MGFERERELRIITCLNMYPAIILVIKNAESIYLTVKIYYLIGLSKEKGSIAYVPMVR